MIESVVNHRYRIMIAGESGQGINSIGEILAKSAKRSGFFVFGNREYPSIIKGGYACYQIELSDVPVFSQSRECDLLVCISRQSVHAYLKRVRKGGVLLHSLYKLSLSEEEEAWIRENEISVKYIDAGSLALEHGGKTVMANTILLGLIWKGISSDISLLSEVVREQFEDKPEVIEPNLKCLQAGHQYNLEQVKIDTITISANNEHGADALLLSGNELVALGAISAGVRLFSSYPMTPSSSILTYLAETADKTGMLVKQAEDEITAAQFVLGAMAMGTRALTATSGGGFDLMTETVSLAGMIEVPFVCVLGQRPGPATGLPTWTSAGDLHLAIHGGHGEFARCVIAISDPESAYILIQKAFSIAEKYQVPVILLSEKQIAEALFSVSSLPDPVSIERFLDQSPQDRSASDRYAITESGVSARWLPGSSEATYNMNSDEHLPDGSLTEKSEEIKPMMKKRVQKLSALLAELPEPELLGNLDSRVTVVGWGSVKNVVLDAIELGAPIRYLHYEYLHPLKIDRFSTICESSDRMILVEHNQTGQLGQLLAQHAGYHFSESLLKYDGSGISVEEIMEII